MLRAQCLEQGLFLEKLGKISPAASSNGVDTQLLPAGTGVAGDGSTLVFAEVKMRESRDFGEAAEAVTWLKRRRMSQLARDYVARHHVANCPCRFDVVSIHLDAGQPVVEIYQNAFDLAL